MHNQNQVWRVMVSHEVLFDCFTQKGCKCQYYQTFLGPSAEPELHDPMDTSTTGPHGHLLSLVLHPTRSPLDWSNRLCNQQLA